LEAGLLDHIRDIISGRIGGETPCGQSGDHGGVVGAERGRRAAEGDATSARGLAEHGAQALQQRLKQAMALDPKELQEKIKETVARCDEAVVDERCRKETVKAVLQSLRKAGFIVGDPRRQRDGDRDEVVVFARKPAGHQAEFRVTLDGGFLYRFDRYEGMACRKDMDRILPMLQIIYGVKLSNERVIWQNPIRDSRTARPMNLGTEAHTHGR